MDLILDHNSRIFFDTAAFIYYFEDNEKYAPIVDNILLSIESAGAEVITSLITYIEIITYPRKMGREDLVAKYRDYFTNSQNVTLWPMDLPVAEKTAQLRASSGYKTPDAIQLATATIHGADIIITNNKKWKSFPETKVLCLEDFLKD